MKTYEKYLTERKLSISELVKKAYYEGWEDCEDEMFDESTGDCFPTGFTKSLSRMKKNYYYEFTKRHREIDLI